MLKCREADRLSICDSCVQQPVQLRGLDGVQRIQRSDREGLERFGAMVAARAHASEGDSECAACCPR